MGTRHLIAVVKDHEYKIAQYGQWDGYPEGQGIDVLHFLRGEGNIDHLEKALSKVRFLDITGRDKEYCEQYDDRDRRTKEQVDWYDRYFSRDVGSEILGNVAFGQEEEILLRNSIGFAGDSLMCEWGYVIDLDAKTLEVYQGFNRQRISEGRFLSGNPELESSDGYEPIKLVKTYELDPLPTKKMFLADLVGDE